MIPDVLSDLSGVLSQLLNFFLFANFFRIFRNKNTRNEEVSVSGFNVNFEWEEEGREVENLACPFVGCLKKIFFFFSEADFDRVSDFPKSYFTDSKAAPKMTMKNLALNSD